MIVAFFLRINMLGKNDWVTQLGNKKVELLLCQILYFVGVLLNDWSIS